MASVWRWLLNFKAPNSANICHAQIWVIVEEVPCILIELIMALDTGAKFRFLRLVSIVQIGSAGFTESFPDIRLHPVHHRDREFEPRDARQHIAAHILGVAVIIGDDGVIGQRGGVPIECRGGLWLHVARRRLSGVQKMGDIVTDRLVESFRELMDYSFTANMEAMLDTVGSIGLLLAYILGMGAVLAAVDWRLALAMGVWVAVYVAWVARCLPRIRAASKRRAEKRAAVNGRFVDSFTNMTTVKLFAHTDREDGYARESIRDTWLSRLTRIVGQFRRAAICSICVDFPVP